MSAKHPVLIVRDAAGMTQEQFARFLGVSRCYLAKVEVRRKPFTSELQRKLAIFAGAWIPMDEEGEPAAPLSIAAWSAHAPGAAPTPLFGLGDPKPYGRPDWEHHCGDWKEKRWGEPALRFDGDEEALAFWLVVLIAGGERAGRAHAVRAEILHAMERIRAEYGLGPHIDGILRNYRPLLPEEIPAFHRVGGRLPTAKWNPARRPDAWLREAVELEPLRLHVTPPGTKKGAVMLALTEEYKRLKASLLKLLAENPSRAVSWLRENLPTSRWLPDMAERVAERRRAAESEA